LGSLAFSKISFAFSPGSQSADIQSGSNSNIPDSTPFTAPDFSKRPAYSEALAGVSGGTRMGP
jgi:hypothetical protein